MSKIQYFSTELFNLLKSIVKGFSSVQRVIFKNSITNDEDGLSKLFESFKSLPKLKLVNLNNNGITDDDIDKCQSESFNMKNLNIQY